MCVGAAMTWGAAVRGDDGSDGQGPGVSGGDEGKAQVSWADWDVTGTSSAQLCTGFYSYSCPGVYDAVKSVMQSAIAREQRICASILRLFFRDFFVQVIYLLLY
ncbi:hypothetical protein BAE44_0018598 [Dichanthelium oligosanthes]|uniref:Plant heme peroxidase family profile domain-containing protein n=1 Tax=Dichanthelium oligosanthes TaxID=888268 RepID=A0A1E5V5E6_9POAL|nr:hypothetical protein BAE44_0018598 [Dichanthelium oligosanthes]